MSKIMRILLVTATAVIVANLLVRLLLKNTPEPRPLPVFSPVFTSPPTPAVQMTPPARPPAITPPSVPPPTTK